MRAAVKKRDARIRALARLRPGETFTEEHAKAVRALLRRVATQRQLLRSGVEGSL